MRRIDVLRGGITDEREEALLRESERAPRLLARRHPVAVLNAGSVASP